MYNYYEIEEIMRSRREELDRELARAARYHPYPEEKKKNRISKLWNVLILSIRNIFMN
jgi:hypothetical protein